MVDKTFGEIVRDRRTELALTQEDVAERGGPSVGWLHTTENDQHLGKHRRVTLGRLDLALNWTAGTAWKLATGETIEPVVVRPVNDQLVELRERAGVSQNALAKAMQANGFMFHQQTVQRIEAGQRPLRVDELIALSDILGVSVDALLGRAAAQQPSVPTVDGLIVLVPAATLGELHRLRDSVNTAIAIRSEVVAK